LPGLTHKHLAGQPSFKIATGEGGASDKRE